MTLFKNRYRIESARLKGWNYASPGAYFVTICTRGRKHFFGEVVGGIMNLTALGDWAQACWAAIPTHFGHVVLDVCQLMPNHVHGILILTESPVETRGPAVETRGPAVETRGPAVETRGPAVETRGPAVETRRPAVETRGPAVETRYSASLPTRQNQFGPVRRGSLSAIVNTYKGAITRWAHLNGLPQFGWQPRFHDHVIRDEAELQRIRAYIRNNPAHWEGDRNKDEGRWI